MKGCTEGHILSKSSDEIHMCEGKLRHEDDPFKVKSLLNLQSLKCANDHKSDDDFKKL